LANVENLIGLRSVTTEPTLMIPDKSLINGVYLTSRMLDYEMSEHQWKHSVFCFGLVSVCVFRNTWRLTLFPHSISLC